MKIGLIGMSGVGKTFWSARLESIGFICHHCDDAIASQLQNSVGEPINSLYDMGKWMGFPYENGFAEKEKQYLALEGQIVVEMADSIRHSPPDTNVVIDTTGSAIYMDKNSLCELKKSVLLVYLAITPNVHNQLLQEYIKHPRPLIWGNLFHKLPDETNEMALRSSYAELIAYREKMYEKCCDIKIAYNIHRRNDFSAADFVEFIQNAAQQNAHWMVEIRRHV